MSEVTVGGKKAKLRLDLGAVRIFNRESGKDFMSLKDADFQDADILGYLFYAVAKRGNRDIEMEDIDSLTFDEIPKFTEAMTEMMEEFSPESEGEEDDPLAESPQD